MNNNLACILSHCDSSEKLISLENNIKTLKKCGFKILLASHIPLDKKITSSVNYFIYDKSNPILNFPEKALLYWKSISINSTPTSLDELLPDYGFTPYNQVHKIGAFCREFNYDNFTFINYDVVITPKIINEITNLQGNVVSKVKWKDTSTKFLTTEYTPSLLLFSFTKKDFNKITPLIKKEDYIKITENSQNPSEFYLNHLLKDTECKIFTEYIEDSFDFTYANIQLWNFNTENDDYSLFFDGDYIILYDLKTPLKINLDGKDIVVDKNVKLKRPLTSLGYYGLNDELININHLLITDRTTAISY
jgi:hypothetical protein|tara:strand:+ start:1286 stop:2203 length:918 start_codon:yes stop_codon:yes gene_type:complete